MLEFVRPRLTRKSLITSLALTALLLSLNIDAQASMAYTQSPFDGGDAIFANTASGAIVADNFNLDSESQLEAIAWWGSYDTSDADDFIVRIYSDASDVPGIEIESYSGIVVSISSTPLIDISSTPVYRYDFNLPQALTLNSGTYYLAISNETINSGWYWSVGTNGDSQHWSLASNGITWEPSFGDQAFSLQTTPVPLPPAFWLMGTGLLVSLRKGSFKAVFGLG